MMILKDPGHHQQSPTNGGLGWGKLFSAVLFLLSFNENFNGKASQLPENGKSNLR